jgi:hypothetical protein
MVQQNYLQIKNDISAIIEREMKKIESDPAFKDLSKNSNGKKSVSL